MAPSLILSLLVACTAPSDPRGPSRAPATSTSTSTSTSDPTTPDTSTSLPTEIPEATFYADADGDGHGDLSRPRRAPAQPAGHVSDSDDCDDTAAEVYPGAPTECDAHADTDCDGLPDPGEVDLDGDGFTVCGGDCDDTEPAAHPDADEVCDGRDDDCDGAIDLDDDSVDPWTCDVCPDPDAFGDDGSYALERWNPCVLDPATVNLCDAAYDTHAVGMRLHKVVRRLELAPRPELFLFFPPGPGDQNDSLLSWAAYAGYRTISLGYDNSKVLEFPCTAPEADAECFGNAREELLYGVDHSPIIEVGPADAAVTRLAVLLAHLHVEHPDDGWDAYLDGEGVVWERVVLAGWSRGSGNVGILSRDHSVASVLYISGPMEPTHERENAAWLDDPRATPGDRSHALWHLDERTDLLTDALDRLGLPDGVSDTDTEPPPWLARLTTSAQDPRQDWCTPHSSMAMDPCMDIDAMRQVYVPLFCAL
ncbi:MAG: hypothetical protein ACI8PZ_002094 [Myxococcota bacterium]|jgi:hypothetical protein